MKLFQSLFAKPRSLDELRADAHAHFQRFDTLVATDTRKALRELDAFDKTALEPLVDFGAELHTPFAERVLAAADAAERRLGVEEPAPKLSDLPALTVHTDPAPEQWEDILAEARKTPDAATYIRYTKAFGGHALVACAVFALRMLTRNRRDQAIFVGDGYAVVRNTFLDALAAHLKGALTSRALEREFDGIATGKLGCEECDGVMTPIGFEVMVYRTAQ